MTFRTIVLVTEVAGAHYFWNASRTREKVYPFVLHILPLLVVASGRAAFPPGQLAGLKYAKQNSRGVVKPLRVISTLKKLSLKKACLKLTDDLLDGNFPVADSSYGDRMWSQHLFSSWHVYADFPR